MKKSDCTAYEWNRLRYDAHRLWKEGLRAGDATIIELMYGYSPRDTEILCMILAEVEQVADARLANYNVDIGF